DRQRACGEIVNAAKDPDVHVVVAAIDLLTVCQSSEDAVTLLVGTASQATALRGGWQPSAHALLTLASIAPTLARDRVGAFAKSAQSSLRLYAAKAAAVLHDRETLDALATDRDSRVAEFARGAATAQPSPRKAPPTVLDAPGLKRLTGARARIFVKDAG